MDFTKNNTILPFIRFLNYMIIKHILLYILLNSYEMSVLKKKNLYEMFVKLYLTLRS